MATSTEQNYITEGFERVTDQLNYRYPSLKNVDALRAYAGTLNEFHVAADRAYYTWVPDSTATPVGAMIIDSPGKRAGNAAGRFYKKTRHCDVVGDFLADNTAATDSAPAINAAIGYAKTMVGINGGTFRYNIQLAAGWYLIYQTIDITNANGVCLIGAGGSYINTGLICCTSAADGSGQGIGVDMTGSIRSFCRHLSITADSVWGKVASKIAVQYALSTDSTGSQLGGLNSGIDDCYIQMYDAPALNGGAGTIGIMNVRAEEFSVTDCYVKANLPLIASNNADLSQAGFSLTVTSPTAIVAMTPGGSMGVADISGQTSLLSIQKRQPAIVLINANSFRVHGYIARSVATLGTNETAIRLVGQCDNIAISGTIESFSQILRTGTLSRRLRFDTVIANQVTPTTNVYDFTGSLVRDSDFTAVFTVPSEFNNGRNLIWHDPVGNGDEPATGNLQNCTFNCSDWVDNARFISGNLLKSASNSRFNSGQPFAKRNGSVIDLKSYPIPLGSVVTGNPDITGTVIRFNKADRTTKGSQNGGYYHATIRGTIRSGIIYSTGGNVAAEISGSAIVTQNSNGTANGVAGSVSILNKSSTAASYIDITGVTMTIDLSQAIGQIKLTIKNSGTANGEPLVFVGSIELASDFYVNQSVIFN